MRHQRYACVLSLIAFGLFAPAIRAQEVEDRSSYYEDDAWYDISEWFDGNDYNPTDEAIGRWDDERFDFADERSSRDRDNDWTYRDYGYADTTADADRWFYDDYDDGYGDWYDYDADNRYESYIRYYDFDDNGVYDGMSYYLDTDGRPGYDFFDYYSFDPTAASEKGRQDASEHQARVGSRVEDVNGEIEGVKTVKVRGTERTIVQVRTSDGKSVAVDLGSEAKAPAKDQRLEARGPHLKVGDKQLIIAMTAKVDGRELAIQRPARRYSGKVQSTREVSVGGRKHLMAKVGSDSGKKMLVDLGQVHAGSVPGEGQQITVEGVPVRIKNRVILMARSLTQDGQTRQIRRAAPTRQDEAKK